MQAETPYWIDKLERKLGWISIPNLAIYLIALQVMGFMLLSSRPQLWSKLILDPAMVMAGEWWRVITFFTVPIDRSFLFIIFLFFLYFVLRTLEQYWGEFKLTFYFLISWVGTVISAMVFGFPVASFTIIELTFFFALATIIPDYEIMAFMVLPVKMKTLALIGAFLGVGLPFLFGSWVERVHLVLAGANYLIFFGPYHYRMFKWKMREK